MFNLTSNRLRVEIAEPGENPNIGQRFDHAGFISDVVLDGGWHFCASEPRNLNHITTFGRGLCDEWCFDACKEAKTGEYFPKFGVGLIRKEEDDGDRYSFRKYYKDVKFFPVKYEHNDNEAVFVTEGEPCLGYAMKNTKTITVSDNMITMVIRAENTGEKTINMREFCHNFMSIDGMALGSDYVIDLPNCPDLGTERILDRNGQSSSFRGNGKGLTFCEFSAVATDMSVKPYDCTDDIPFVWRLYHKGAKLYVETRDYYKPAMINIWAVDHIVAPEINHTFVLEPGEAHEFKREWRFGTL